MGLGKVYPWRVARGAQFGVQETCRQRDVVERFRNILVAAREHKALCPFTRPNGQLRLGGSASLAKSEDCLVLFGRRRAKMGSKKKATRILIKLVSMANTGFFYVTSKNPRTHPEKLQLIKHDPRVNKHVLFVESKLR